MVTNDNSRLRSGDKQYNTSIGEYLCFEILSMNEALETKFKLGIQVCKIVHWPR